MLQWFITVFCSLFCYSFSSYCQPQVSLNIEIQSSALVIEQTLSDWPISKGISEFTIDSSYEVLEASPMPLNQKFLTNEKKLLRFPAVKKYQFRYRIPVSFSQSSQISFNQEQSWYLNPVEGLKAIYQLQWQNKTQNTSLQIIHSAVPVLQDGISAMLGFFKKYEKVAARGVRLQTYLINPDDALAEVLLSSLLKYFNHYETLIGAYPYENFSVVENVDPTGYAFPTMTWIGSQLLRFPFILTTSLPHELLHSWWGNGVFVDARSGNWCEGLTTYLADHFFQVSESAKKDYRLKQILEYENYTRSGQEISLAEFRSRGEDRSLQAIGYSKSMFVFMMLENQIGEAHFRETLKKFYSDFRGKEASFRDFFNTAEDVSGQKLEDFFKVWILGKGSLDLTFLSHSKTQKFSKFWLNSLLKPDFHIFENMQIPATIKSKNHPSFENFTLPIHDQKLSIVFQEEPDYVWFDPDFKVFRRLKPQEKPNVLSEVLGAEKIAYLQMSSRSIDSQVQAEILKIERKQFEALEEAQADFTKPQTLIVFGSFDNIFKPLTPFRLQIQNVLSDRGVYLKNEDQVEIQGRSFAMAGNALFLAISIQNTKVLLLLTSEELNGTRIVQRMTRYGAQSFVLLGGTSAVTQGLWHGLESELKVRF